MSHENVEASARDRPRSVIDGERVVVMTDLVSGGAVQDKPALQPARRTPCTDGMTPLRKVQLLSTTRCPSCVVALKRDVDPSWPVALVAGA